jgi:hypothetical protein
MHDLILIAARTQHDRGGGNSNTMAVLAITAAVILAIVGRFVTHGMDRSRIQKYADGQGWELLSCQWKLLGPGWFARLSASVRR